MPISMADPLSIDDAITAAATRQPGIVGVYLFGSIAAGRTHRESDVDLAVLLDWSLYPNAAARFEARLRLIADLSVALRRNDIDLVILNDAPPHLAREIVTRGRRMFVSDDAVDRAFRRDAMLRAADLEPFLRRTRRIKLRALMP
jgi:predicted nucleotidyltransferase